MNIKKSVIPLILLILGWINLNQALQSNKEIQLVTLEDGIEISLPKIAMSLSDTLTIPVSLTGLNDAEVFSTYFKIAYDSTVVQINDVELGDLTTTWNNPTWYVVNNELRISHYGVSPFTEDGIILNILVTASGEENSLTELEFVLGALNEGNPQAEFNNGRVFLGNPTPVINPISDTLFTESDNLSIEINVFDPLDKELILELTNLPSGASFLDNGDGSSLFTWQTDYYSAGRYMMLFSALNEDSLSSELEWNLTIENTPQAPQFITPFEDISFAEDELSETLSLEDFVSDSDLDQGDSLLVSLEGQEEFYLDYTNGLISFSSLANWFGTGTASLIISDTYGFEINQDIQVEVTNVNDDIEQLQTLPLVNMDEDYQEYSLDLTEYFSDIDNELIYSVNNAEDIDYLISDNILTILPHQDWYGIENIELVVREGDVIDLQGQVVAEEVSESNEIIANLTVNVSPINDGPEMLHAFPEVKVLMNGSKLLENIDNYFQDVDSNLSYSFSNSSNLSISYSDNAFQIIPNSGWVGVDRITVTATDDFNLSISQVLIIRVQAGYSFTEDFNHDGSFPAAWLGTGGNWIANQETQEDWSIKVENPRISRTQRFISEVFDLTGIYDIEISFDHDLVKPNGVTAIFQYSLNGFTYYNIENFSQSTSGIYTVELPQVSNNSTVRFRWQYLSSTVASNYWNIDDFEIFGVVGNYLPPAEVDNFHVDRVNAQDVVLAWSSIENNFFNQYEISVMNSPSLTDQLFIWNGENDESLYSQETETTIITQLTSNSPYYFAVRSSDVSGNVSEWSEIIAATPTAMPIITFLTDDNSWFNTRNPIISVNISDDVLVDASTIVYRIDLNKNGVYDLGEDWIVVDNYQNSDDLNIEIPLELISDGEDYKLEVRCSDTQNNLYSYSGTNSELGIADDLSFNVDTENPVTISDLMTTDVTDSSVTLEWYAYTESDFSNYEIYYSLDNEVTLEDNLFSAESDPNLNVNTTSTSLITGLENNQRYWFAIIAVDRAGNKSNFSNIVTNVLASDLPLIYDVTPLQEEPMPYFNSRQIQLSCKIKDAYGIDFSTVQYRNDANGNGQYDADEVWIDAYNDNLRITSRTNQGSLNAEGDYELHVIVQADWLGDGDNLCFEFRAKDISGYGYSYSGFNQDQGIEDDWSVNVDSTSPSAIDYIEMGLTTTSSAEIAWSASADNNFLGYKIFYSTEMDVTDTDDFVSWEQYPELASAGSDIIIFVLENLEPNEQYFLKVAAVDIAGNHTFSEQVLFTTSNDAKPRKPENLNIAFQGNDLVLTWDSVTEDTNGSTLEDVVYDIYVSERPDFELDGSNYYDSTYENQYIFFGIGNALPKIFFKVQAYSD